jgi:hypothetical protein
LFTELATVGQNDSDSHSSSENEAAAPSAGGHEESEDESESDSGSDTSRDMDGPASGAGKRNSDNGADEPPSKRQKQMEVDAALKDKSAGLRLISADDVVFHVPAYHLQSARYVEPGMESGT